MKIGLLPFYLKLYDDTLPETRVGVEAFRRLVSHEFTKRGAEVIDAPICRVGAEFDAAVNIIEKEGADAIVTLHLAYSPSGESIGALMRTKLPIIVLDTTPDYSFDSGADPSAIMYNHGIHGVQDMCSVLRRNGRHFELFAGHITESAVIDDALNAIRGAVMAASIRSARVGIIGAPFAGMGDFTLPFDFLREKLGMEVVRFNGKFPVVTDEMVMEEYVRDSERCDMSGVGYDDYARCERVALGVRGWIEKNRLSAFTMSFSDAARGTEFSVVPFAEACKAMARGVGYAGEGDVLTAAFVGALLSVYPDTSFAEMFCPDWAHDAIFISHMGEYNPRCTNIKAKYMLKEFPFADAYRPTVFIAPFMPGEAVFACLAPAAGGRFTLIMSEIEMLETPADTKFNQTVCGWFRTGRPVAEFLRAYSLLGGIHHAAVVYGGNTSSLTAFARFMGWDAEII